RIAHELAFFPTVPRYLGTCLGHITIERAIMPQEVYGCTTQPGAILKHQNMFSLGVCPTDMFIIGSRQQTGVVTSLQILHTLLKFYPNHRVFCILLHASLSFCDCLSTLFSQCFRASTRQDGCGFYRCSYFGISRLRWIGFAFQQMLKGEVERLRQ